MDFNKKDNQQSAMQFPPIIFGTATLGNLFVALSEEEKLEIIEQYVRLSNGPVVFDTAGKYGAGLALETIGHSLKKLGVKPEDVIISNKLGWLRTELKTEVPTFEPGVWKDLKYDAIQKISYDGILECFEQGNELLNGYHSQMVSVHDPDEYLAKAKDAEHEKELYHDILGAYKALFQLKQEGKAQSVGVGAKDWRSIQKIANDVDLDWVMIANSMTIKSHPSELLKFMEQLERKGVLIFNSAVFHSGFLVGSNYYDYKLLQPGTPEADAQYEWRDKFYNICERFDVKPAEACVQFALNAPGVVSVALSTSNARRVKENIQMVYAQIPAAFWDVMKKEGMISEKFPISNQAIPSNNS